MLIPAQEEDSVNVKLHSAASFAKVSVLRQLLALRTSSLGPSHAIGSSHEGGCYFTNESLDTDEILARVHSSQPYMYAVNLPSQPCAFNRRNVTYGSIPCNNDPRQGWHQGRALDANTTNVCYSTRCSRPPLSHTYGIADIAVGTCAPNEYCLDGV